MGRTGRTGRTSRTRRAHAETASSSSRGGGLECRAVEDPRGLVADLLKDSPHGAVFFRHAFFAGRVRRLADARDEGERSVERADDVAHADLVGRAAQLVATAGSLAAVYEAGGRQYVAFCASGMEPGGETSMAFTPGKMEAQGYYVFALPRTSSGAKK